MVKNGQSVKIERTEIRCESFLLMRNRDAFGMSRKRVFHRQLEDVSHSDESIKIGFTANYKTSVIKIQHKCTLITEVFLRLKPFNGHDSLNFRIKF